MNLTNDLSSGTIWKQLTALSLPLIWGNILQQMYNTIDAFIVGHYIGVTAFAAAGVVGFVQEYLKIIYLGLPAAFLYNWCAAVLRGAGDTKASLWILMIAVPKQVLNLQSPANRGIRADFIPMESRFFL